MNLEEVSDSEWSELAATTFNTQQSLQDLQLAERWILSSLHQVSGPIVLLTDFYYT